MTPEFTYVTHKQKCTEYRMQRFVLNFLYEPLQILPFPSESADYSKDIITLVSLMLRER